MPKPTAAGDVESYDGECDAAAARGGSTPERHRERRDHQPHRGRPVGQRRGVHAHHRADRRLGDRGARPRLPAQQRADRLHGRVRPEGPEPDPARQAPAQLDVADDPAAATASRALALGSPGGSTIITTVLQTLFNRLDRDMTLPQAIAAPRAAQRNTATVTAEPAFIAAYGAAAGAVRPRVHALGRRLHQHRRDRGGHRHRVRPRRAADRRRRADAPRRRLGPGGPAAVVAGPPDRAADASSGHEPQV